MDCTTGACSGLDTGHNGYGDNLDCAKTIVAPVLPDDTSAATLTRGHSQHCQQTYGRTQIHGAHTEGCSSI